MLATIICINKIWFFDEMDQDFLFKNLNSIVVVNQFFCFSDQGDQVADQSSYTTVN